MTPFDWEQSAYLGYMVEQYEKNRGNDLFGNPLDDDDDDDESENNEYDWPGPSN